MNDSQVSPPTGDETPAPNPQPKDPTYIDPTVELRNLLRFIYTNNPFYVISAGLTLWGLYQSFDTSVLIQSNALMACMAGYILLLAVSSVLLIRVGQVWDDVRTMLLLVVLLLLAVSLSFDKALSTNPDVGQYYFYGGLVFAVVISEAVLHGTRLSLPMLFRLPYHSILGVFFLYPVAIRHWIHNPKDPVLQWALFGFSSVAAVAFLTLLPAIRRGATFIRLNGSPWRWPWYPWTLFGVLAFGVAMRSYCLCVSFHPVKGMSTMFAPYFLVPFLLVLCLLILEIGLKAKHRAAIRFALVAPLVIIPLAIVGTQAGDFGFRQMLTNTLGGSPLFFTALGVAGFHGYALLRRATYAAEALTASLALLCVCGRQTEGVETLVVPQLVPLLLIAVLQGWLTVWHRSSLRCLAAAGCLLTAIALHTSLGSLAGYRAVAAGHGLLFVALLIGLGFHDRFARFLQYAGALTMVIFSQASNAVDTNVLGGLPEWLPAVYPALMGTLALGYGYVAGNKWFYAAAGLTLVGWFVTVVWQYYPAARRWVPGLDYILLGMAFFALALAVSLLKTGLPQRLLTRFTGES